MFKTKKILTLLFLVLSLNGFCQINKGQWIIGGNAAFGYFKYYSTKNTTLTLSPSLGYFFLNRFAGGLRFSYDAGYYSFQSGGKSRETFVSVAPFFRYYFLPTDQKINILADAGFGYSWGKFRNFSQSDFKYHSKIISFKTGPSIFLNQHTALEITLAYNHSIKGGLGDTLAVNNFQVGVGFQIHLGNKHD